MTSTKPETQTRLNISFAEFIAMCAVLMALNSLAIDIMLPALPDIGRDLNVLEPNDRQLVITAYLVPFGFAQLIYGPLADRFGRKPILLIGLAIYTTAGLASMFAPSFEMLLAARVLQGIGGAGPRVLATAIVRDCFGGRQMAKVMSLVIMVFIAMPVIAPSLGQIMIMIGHWRWTFGLLMAGGFIVFFWLGARLPETLDPQNRTPLSLKSIAAAYKITFTTRITLGYMIATALAFGGMFGFLNSAQQILVGVYHTGTAFPLIFASIALGVSVASLANARLVMRIGMRVLSHYALTVMTTLFAVHTAIAWAGLDSLGTFIPLMLGSFFCIGLLLSNLNALAMVPVGHIAGSASAIIGFVGTAGGAIPGYLIGQAFDGTIIPVVAGFTILGLLSIVVVFITEKGRMFHPGEGT